MTGQVRTIDAKVDTGAAVTIIPKDVIDGLELPSLGNWDFSMVDGTPLSTEAFMCRLSFSDEDSIDTPIYVCDTESGIVRNGCPKNFVTFLNGMNGKRRNTLSILRLNYWVKMLCFKSFFYMLSQPIGNPICLFNNMVA